MKIQTNNMKKTIIFIILFFIIIFLAIIIYYQESLVHPARRVLQSYHYEWLNHPEQHSMKIIKDEKHKDILIVKRDNTLPLSMRSQKVLRELKEHGYEQEKLQKRGIIVMFHGKNGRKEDLLPVAERYVTAGFTCVLVDLPAHGESLKTEMKYTEKLDKTVLSVVQKYVDIYAQPIYFWGMSLGGRYAIVSSSNYDKKVFPEPKALILVSTFDTLSYVLKEKSVALFGAYIAEVLYRSLRFSLKFFYDLDPEKIDSITTAQGIKLPVFVLHGAKDKLIGYEHGKNLFEQFPNKRKVFHLDKNGDHHNILVTDYPFYLESILFLLEGEPFKE